MGATFVVIPSNAEEAEPEHLTPHEMCRANAYRKALSIARLHPDHLVLGADTLVFLGTRVYAKPNSLEEAKRMLRELSGRTHHVITGVCLVHHRVERTELFSESTAVTFKTLSGEDIEDYLSRMNPLDKAGAYAIQEHGDRIVAAVEGSYSNVVGLPMERVSLAVTAALS